MRTIITLNNGDEIHADLIERQVDKLKVYCRYMADATAIDFYLNDCGVIEWQNASDSGVYLWVRLDEVFGMTKEVED